MSHQIDPDQNPVYQELIDTLFALNCIQSSYAYSIQPTSETECTYTCSVVGGNICFENQMLMTRALALVKTAHARWDKGTLKGAKKMSNLKLEATMHGVAIVDAERGDDIVAVVDPNVHCIAMMRPEDITQAELLCQAPIMAEKIKQLEAQNGQLRIIIEAACVGSCTCLTKTHESDYHGSACRYRIIKEALSKLETTNHEG